MYRANVVNTCAWLVSLAIISVTITDELAADDNQIRGAMMRLVDKDADTHLADLDDSSFYTDHLGHRSLFLRCDEGPKPWFRSGLDS